MTRLNPRHGRSRSAALTAGNAATQHHKMLTDRKKPSYKVVLEQVQKKKELITAGSISAIPPKGYTFIPAGDPQVTNRCKELALADGAKVYVVSTQRPHNNLLAPHVHRVGYHFPSYIVGNACSTLGITLDKHGRVLHHQQTGQALGSKQPEKKRKASQINDAPAFSPELTQAAIDTQARNAIKDLFPNIPDKDMHEVVRRAFEKGKNLVGTSFELSLQRRVQLAVVAHIRHVYTDYDKLLREVPWVTARRMVEQQSLDVVAKWIREVNNTEAYEDILREVIVIPDDDDDDEVKVPVQGSTQDITQDGPVFTSRHLTMDDLETRPLDYGARQGSSSRFESPDPFERGQALGHGQYVMQPHQQDLQKTRQIGMRRQQLWEQALDRRMKEPETYRVVKEASREHPPLAFRTIEAYRPSGGSAHPLQNRDHPTGQARPISSFQPVPHPQSVVQHAPVQFQIPKIQHGTLSENRVTQAHAHDAHTIERPARIQTQPHPTSTSMKASHHYDGTSHRALPYRVVEQRLVSSHQSLHEPFKQEQPYYASAFVEKLVPSIEGPSQEKGQSSGVTVAQRPSDIPFPAKVSQENMPPHRPALQRVISHADDHVNLAKRRRTDDVNLQDHGFWRPERQHREEQLSLLPLTERNRQVEYINYGGIRQQACETRLVPLSNNVPSNRQLTESRDQGNWERFSSKNQESIMVRPVQPHEALRHAPRASTFHATISSHDSKSALHPSHSISYGRPSGPSTQDRPADYAQHSLQQSDPTYGKPSESNSITRWEDPRREIIVIDSPESPRTVRAVTARDDAAWSTRAFPIRGLQAHGSLYEVRPASYLVPHGSNEQQHRIVLQNGETLHRYNPTTESQSHVKQEKQPVFMQQQDYMLSPRRNTMEEGSNPQQFAHQQRQPYSPDAEQDRRRPFEQGPPLQPRTFHYPEDALRQDTEASQHSHHQVPSAVGRSRRVFDERTRREIIVIE